MNSCRRLPEAEILSQLSSLHGPGPSSSRARRLRRRLVFQRCAGLSDNEGLNQVKCCVHVSPLRPKHEHLIQFDLSHVARSRVVRNLVSPVVVALPVRLAELIGV